MRFEKGNKYGQKYKINENSFNFIDSELTAYCLGFLYADGSLGQYNNDYNIRINIQKRDIEILNLFKKCFETNRPIIESKRGDVLLTISNKQVYHNLISKGLCQAKTFKIQFPHENIVPNYLKRHFIRGYFDGDGSVTVGKNRVGQISFNITSNYQFINSLKKEMINIGFSNVKIIKVKNSFVLSYSGTKNAKRFYDFIYNKSSFYLKRKKLKFEKHFKRIRDYKTKPYQLISPDGIVTKVLDFKTFQEQNDICKTSIYKLVKGKSEIIKGWKLYKPSV